MLKFIYLDDLSKQKEHLIQKFDLSFALKKHRFLLCTYCDTDPKSHRHASSPYNFNTLSNKQVMIV